VDGIEILLDQGLRGFERIYPAAGTDATGVPMTFDELLSITGGSVADLAAA
jgi:prolyl-tRNA editing enzyme YbaK/EbsC (Cys-tRNA(Pro) deacylase)